MLLYHYCSNDTFLSILRNSELWLSELTLSNDSMEGAWVWEVFKEASRDRDLSPTALDDFSEKIRSLLDVSSAFGFCLSAKGDLLSQWRGYADNGAGIAIGFDRKCLDVLCEESEVKISHGLCKLIYNRKEQVNIIDRHVTKLEKLVNEGAIEINHDVRCLINYGTNNSENNKLFHYIFQFYLIYEFFFKLKNPAFSEEKEFRILKISSSYDKNKLSYIGKYNEVSGNINFRARGDHIVPYLRLPIPDDKRGCIREIILGPRNRTPEPVIRAALEKYGFHKVKKIRRSAATYR